MLLTCDVKPSIKYLSVDERMMLEEIDRYNEVERIERKYDEQLFTKLLSTVSTSTSTT